MGIGGLMDYSHFTSSYGMQNIPKVDIADLQKQNAAVETSVQPVQPIQPEISTPVNQASKIANLEDISLTFNREDSFDYIGSESSITDLDIDRVVSNAKKDDILSDYQYFVGSSANFLQNQSADGAVFLK